MELHAVIVLLFLFCNTDQYIWLLLLRMSVLLFDSAMVLPGTVFIPIFLGRGDLAVDMIISFKSLYYHLRI